MYKNIKTEDFSSDDSADEEEILQNFDEEATVIIQSETLPQKSSERYLFVYNNYKKWQEENKNTLSTDSEENNLIFYFNTLKERLKPPTLWSIWSMLRSTLKTKDNVDISKFVALKSIIKDINKGYKPKKSLTLTWDEIMNFMATADDYEYLATKIILIFGICGALRCDEIIHIKLQDVQDLGDKFLVSIQHDKNDYPGQFIIGNLFYDKVKKYILLRPIGQFSDRFFIQYQNGKCTRQVIGKNKISEVPGSIASYLNLENTKKYTGHCFRRTVATLLSNSSANMRMGKQLGKWRADIIAQGYIENSIRNKQLIYNSITHAASSTNIHSKPSTSNLLNESTTSVPSESTSTVPNENKSDNNSDSESSEEFTINKFDQIPEKMNPDDETNYNSDDSLPPELLEETKNISLTLLPEKSRKLYTVAYIEFKKWRKAKNKNSFSEEVLLLYFNELSKNLAPPTLWARYSMLKATIQTFKSINIGEYKQLISFLKQQNTGHKAKKSKVFTANDVKRFCNEAPDKRYLATKVALIVGITGACRREELTNLTTDDVEDFNSMLLIKIPIPKKRIARSFTIDGEFYKICKKFILLRPKETKINRFFLQYHNGTCTRQPIGINKFGAMPKEIATFLNLPHPELYTGHSFRRTSACLLADAGGDITTLKRNVGSMCSVGAQRGTEKSTNSQMFQQITNSINVNPLNCIDLNPLNSVDSNPSVDINPSVEYNPLFTVVKEEHEELEEYEELEDLEEETIQNRLKRAYDETLDPCSSTSVEQTDLETPIPKHLKDMQETLDIKPEPAEPEEIIEQRLEAFQKEIQQRMSVQINKDAINVELYYFCLYLAEMLAKLPQNKYRRIMYNILEIVKKNDEDVPFEEVT